MTKDTVQASVADGSIKLSEKGEATSKFKCDLCDFESISRGTKATHQKKAPNITGRWNCWSWWSWSIKPKENISDDMVKEKETSIETIYELNLDEIQIHVGHRTPQLS